METFIVILVLLALIALFGGVGYFFVRETGWDNARLWITSPRQARQITTPSPGNDTSEAAWRDRWQDRATSTGSMPVMLDENALRELREELHGELTRAAGLTREFDMRLTRMEADLTAARQLPEEIDSSVRETVKEVETRTRVELNQLQVEFRSARVADSPYGQRRAEALAELYASLAQMDAALAAVINPMLLPGEPLQVPDELFDDTLDWENWSDVGDRAYAFGQIFNRDRIVLSPDLADQIEGFLSTFRHALTGTVSPVVQNPSRTPSQIQQMKSGLGTIVDALPPLRREIESHYREHSVTSKKPGA
ncbi:MAG TPA: hypothetical protein VNZ58_14675 [Thermomicrobiales bacterium]|nr:hypothetical protein [Thermomicrobiales bacterium]